MSRLELNNNQLKGQNNQAKKQTHLLRTQSKPSQRKMTERFQQITEDLDRSFTSRNQDKEKANLISKAQRLDTRQSELQPYRINPTSKQLPQNQPMKDMIRKSQNDPFLRRKLNAFMQNDIKSLKKLNDQKNKSITSSTSSSISLRNIYKSFVQQNHVLESQYTRIPKDIGKIFDFDMSTNGNINLKKVGSQPYLVNFAHKKLYHKLTLPENHEQVKPQENFTTLRKQAYKNKLESLEQMREIHQKQPLIKKIQFRNN